MRRAKIVRERLARASTTWRALPLLICRVTLGWEFLVSGWLKLHDRPGVVQYFTQLRIPVPAFNAALVTWSELVCGTLLLVGLLSRLATIPVLVTMTVALLTAKLRDVHGLSDLFYQVEFTYICMLIVVLVLGPGSVSVDGVVAGAVDRSGRKAPPRRSVGRAPGAAAPAT